MKLALLFLLIAACASAQSSQATVDNWMLSKNDKTRIVKTNNSTLDTIYELTLCDHHIHGIRHEASDTVAVISLFNEVDFQLYWHEYEAECKKLLAVPTALGFFQYLIGKL